jgi:hypothetical protein
VLRGTGWALGDVFGRKRVFQLGLALFVVSCVLIALSNTGGAVIAGRMIQGAAGPAGSACFRWPTPAKRSSGQYRCGVPLQPSAQRRDPYSAVSWSSSQAGKACSGLTQVSLCFVWC